MGARLIGFHCEQENPAHRLAGDPITSIFCLAWHTTMFIATNQYNNPRINTNKNILMMISIYGTL
jgi:hypothetical protein